MWCSCSIEKYDDAELELPMLGSIFVGRTGYEDRCTVMISDNFRLFWSEGDLAELVENNPSSAPKYIGNNPQMVELL